MKTKILTLIMLCLCSFSITVHSETCNKNFLSVSGNKLYDANGNEVRLTGVNWFGFETSMGYFHGLWSRDMKSMLQQIKDQGFNCIRIPWNNSMLDQTISISSFGTDAYTGVSPMNEEESTKTTPIEVLDIAIEWCQENNLKVILDNHSREADGYMNEKLWYTDDITHEQWIEDWEMMAERYKDYDAVIAMDINNEPHGSGGEGSQWGTNDESNDWRLAAQECGNAILAVNPNVIVMVEGVQEYDGVSYWWGGNLQGVADYPVVLSDSTKLMYSAHDYGPTVSDQDWFSDESFPDNMPDIWETYFNYLNTDGISPILIGEFGIRDQDGDDEVWIDKLLEFMGEQGLSWTYWCWNPNSGDTGGILDDDWSTIVDWKMEKLEPYLADEIPNCTGGSTTDTTDTDSDTIAVTGIELSPDTLTISVGKTGTLTATFSPSNASNTDISWTSDDTEVATIDSDGTVTAISEGSVTITATTDDGGYTASAAVIVEPADTLECDFGTPLDTPLPSINSTFNYVYVSDNGPDLSNLSDFTINWDLDNNGLWQLSINTTDGQPAYWNDLSTNATYTFSSSSPTLTLSETGFDGLDGTYYVATDDDNFVMVEESGLYYIYFSNSTEAPCSSLKVANMSSMINLTQENAISVYPNPFNSTFYVELEDAEIENIKIYNSIGKLMDVNVKFNSESKATIDFEGESGLYFIHIQTGNKNTVKQILKLN